MSDYNINTSSGITGIEKIIWADGTVQVSSPTAVGGGGVAAVNHRLALYGGVANSQIYNSSDTTYGFGSWFEICAATGNIHQFVIGVSSPTTETPIIRVWFNGVSTATLTIPSGSSPLSKIYAVGITVNKSDVIGVDFEGVGNNPTGGVSIIAVLKEN